MKLFRSLLISLFFALSFFVGTTHAADVCDIEDPEACESSGEAEIYGETEHADDCDKTIYVFYGEECTHCAEFDRFLESDILPGHPEIEVKKLEVWHDDDNYQKMVQMLKELGVKERAVPAIVVGHQVFVGYASDELTGAQIKKSIYDLYCIDEDVEGGGITVPFLGKIDVGAFSVVGLTVVLGLIDGFNPCAMWALVALMTILLATKSRKKIFLIGGTFLIVSWIIYYIFIAFYLNAFVLLSYVAAIRYLIGAVALFAGGYYLKEFFTYQPGVCKVTNPGQQKSIMDRMRNLTQKNSLLLILLGVTALAFSVNMIEMICSLGVPVVYTQILAQSDLSSLGRYGYLALYNTLYMLDDFIVFIIAATTLRHVQINQKYDRLMKLLGGLLIIALGLVLIFWPELLG